MLKKYLPIEKLIPVAAAIMLIGLIVLATLLAASTISRTVSEQFRSQEQQLVGSLARQIEFLFNVTAGDLLNLASRPEVRSAAPRLRDNALILFEQEAQQHIGTVSTIIRLDAQGEPRYAWPAEVDERILNGEALDWRIGETTARQLSRSGGPQFYPAPSSIDGLTYLLIAPVESTDGQRELIAFEMELTDWFQENIQPSNLGSSGQLWVIDGNGRLIYQATENLAWDATSGAFSIPELLNVDGPDLREYEAPDGQRQAAFAPARSYNAGFVVILSRLVSDSQVGVQQQVYTIFAVTFVALLLVGTLYGLFTRRMYQEERRRQQAEQRRHVAGAMLEVARAMNSSLDLDEVFRRILTRLGDLLTHDSASIFLRTDNEMTVAAYTGNSQVLTKDQTMDLEKARAAAEVFKTGEPSVIVDCMNDPRWALNDNLTPIRSWMGVPLRVRGEVVGVLNINSFQREGFKREDQQVAQLFADQAGVAISNARLHEQQIRQYQEELENAEAIQSSLLPGGPVHLAELEVIGYSLPARTVNGDFYQFIPRLDGRLSVGVGDVTGKGMPAALLMAVITTALRRDIDRQPSAVALLDDLNESLFERMHARHMHGALIVALFDPKTRRAEVANAGMIQPYLRDSRGCWEAVDVCGYPLGATTRRRYSSKVLTLAPGAVLVMMSDGAVEARNAAGEMFGFERLEALLASLPRDLDGEAIIHCIIDAVRSHLDGQEPQDDVTLVVMRSLDTLTPSGYATGVTIGETTAPPQPGSEGSLAPERAAQGESDHDP